MWPLGGQACGLGAYGEEMRSNPARRESALPGKPYAVIVRGCGLAIQYSAC